MNKHVGASLRKYCAPSRIADIFLKKKNIYIYIQLCDMYFHIEEFFFLHY